LHGLVRHLHGNRNIDIRDTRIEAVYGFAPAICT